MNVLNTLSRVFVAASMFGAAAMAQGVPKPTAEHGILAADVGTWDAKVKMFEGGPGAAPTESKGTEVNELMPGGLWLVSKFDGSFGGVTFQGRGQFTYDAEKKKYIGTWIDSMGPMLSVLEGTYDAKTKTMTYVGDGVDPGTKAKFTQRMVTTTKDGVRVFSLYMKFEKAEEMKFMEITYSKRP